MLEIIDEQLIKEAILNAIPKRTCLAYVDYRDSLDGSVAEFQTVLDGGEWWETIDKVVDDYWLWDQQAHSISHIIDEDIKPVLSDIVDGDEDEINSILDDYDDLIRDTCQERDESTPYQDLLNNTRAEPVLGILYSNYEGIGGAWSLDQQGYVYEEALKDLIDVLQLNPAEVKAELVDNDRKVSGRWPAKPKRVPYVSVYQFLREIANTASNCNLLTFKGLLDLGDLKDFSGKITFHAGNDCGLFDPCCGSGSISEMTLLRDFVVDTSKRYGDADYDHFRLRLDRSLQYSMNDVYGPTRAFWGGSVTVPK